MLPKPNGTWRVFYHYNKQYDCWSVHFKGACHVVEDLECRVPAEGHKQKTQPRRIMRGWARDVIVTPQKATIV